MKTEDAPGKIAIFPFDRLSTKRGRINSNFGHAKNSRFMRSHFSVKFVVIGGDNYCQAALRRETGTVFVPSTTALHIYLQIGNCHAKALKAGIELWIALHLSTSS